MSKNIDNSNSFNNFQKIQVTENVSYELNMSKAELRIGDDIYTISYGNTDLTNLKEIREKVMGFVKELLTSLGETLDIRKFDKISIDSEKVSYGTQTKNLSEISDKLSDKFKDIHENNQSNVKTTLTEYFKALNGPNVEQKVKEALESANRGKELIKAICNKSKDQPEQTIQNLRDICWYLMVKSAEQGEFHSRGSIRFQDQDKYVFNWLKGFENKGLYRRISTHYQHQSATTDKKNFLGLSKGPKLQPNQYGIEDYESQLLGDRAGFLFDELKDGSIFIKIESVGVPTKESAISSKKMFNSDEETLTKKYKEHHKAHVGNFLSGKRIFSGRGAQKVITKIFGEKVKENLRIKNATKSFKDRKEHIPKEIKEDFKLAVNSLVTNKKERDKLIKKGLEGDSIDTWKSSESKDELLLGGVSSMQKIIEQLSKDEKSEPVQKFKKSIKEFSQDKVNQNLQRVGNEVIVKLDR